MKRFLISCLAMAAALGARAEIVFSPGSIFDTGLRVTDFASADVDRDGFLDIIFTNMTGNSYGIAYNDGLGGFSNPEIELLPGQRNNPLAVDAADIDGDGFIDLAIAYNQTIDSSPQPFRDSAVLVMWGSANGFDGETELEMFGVPSSVLIEDVNGDSTLDVVIGNNGGFFFDLGFVDQIDPGIVIFENMGGRSLNDANEIITDGAIVHLAAADFNNDGRIDILGSNQGIVEITLSPIGIRLSNTRVTLFSNSDSGLAVAGGVPLDLPPWGVAAGHLNDDDFIDLAVGVVGSSDPLNVLQFLGTNASVTLLRNTGFGFAEENVIQTPGVTFAPILNDFDADGDLDLAATVQIIQGNVLVPRLVFYEQDAGAFVEVARLNVEEEPRYAIARDFDNDGDDDIAVLCVIADSSDPTDSSVGRIYVFKNDQITAVGEWPLFD